MTCLGIARDSARDRSAPSTLRHVAGGDALAALGKTGGLNYNAEPLRTQWVRTRDDAPLGTHLGRTPWDAFGTHLGGTRVDAPIWANWRRTWDAPLFLQLL